MQKRHAQMTKEFFDEVKRAISKKRKKTTFIDIGLRYRISHMTVSRINKAKHFGEYGSDRRQTSTSIDEVKAAIVPTETKGEQQHLPTFSPEDVQQHNDLAMLTISINTLTVAVLDLTKAIKVNNRAQGYANHLNSSATENKEPSQKLESERSAISMETLVRTGGRVPKSKRKAQ